MKAVLSLFCLMFVAPLNAEEYKYLGKYSSNKYDQESISNPNSTYGSKYSQDSVNNPYGEYGSKYSQKSVANPYATDSPKIYANDGTYLGKASSNKYDPESISNPNGRYGSQYSPDSVNNPYGKYGSKYSQESANNPYATDSPKVYSVKENPYKVRTTADDTENTYIRKSSYESRPAYNTYEAPKVKSYSNPYSVPATRDYSRPSSGYGNTTTPNTYGTKKKNPYGF